MSGAEAVQAADEATPGPVTIGPAELWHGDCQDVLMRLPAASIDAVVCDPPYGLGFMGKAWDHGVPSADVWRAVLRVLKPGGHLLAFGGTRTYHRMACAIEDAGFEIRDQIGWAFGSGFPKSKSLDGAWAGWGTALKPAWEPVVLARKPLIGTVAANVLAHGTGALNIDRCRVEIGDDLPAHATPGAGAVGSGGVYAGGFAGVAQGAREPHPDSVRHDARGRWPANLIHDGSDEVVALFPQTSSGSLDQGSVAGRMGAFVYGDHAGYLNPKQYAANEGSAARFFYCAKASKADRDDGCGALEGSRSRGVGALRDGTRETEPRRNHHPTVKPTDLMRYLRRLITPPGGVVLDPFMGSGSTGRGALLEGFRFVGIERDADYFAIACARIGAAARQGDLFGAGPRP